MLAQVQSGGSFDIDFEIKDPTSKTILSATRERQGDYVLTGNTKGEYSFCFVNDMSTLTDKLVDFDVSIESEPRREAPAKAGQIKDQTSALEESIFRLNGMLMNIKRMQKLWDLLHFRPRVCAHHVSATTRKRTAASILSSLPKISCSGMPFWRVWLSSAWLCT